MASQILTGASNPSYTNNTGQNVRVVINYMNGNSSGEITLNWAGVSVTESNIEAVGKNVACASAFYGDYFSVNKKYWKWIKKTGFFPRSAVVAQNAAVRMPNPLADADFSSKKRFKQWLLDPANADELAGFSFAIAIPLEIFLAPNQTFSAICGVYNIVVIKEDGN